MTQHNPKLAKVPDSTLQELAYGARLSSRWRRLGAYLLDACLVGTIVILYQITRGVYAGFPHMARPTFNDQLAGTVMAIAAWCTFNGFLLKHHGQTIGKRVLLWVPDRGH